MNHRYPVILLDADDTLLDFDRAETAAVSGTLARAGLDPTPAILARYKEINRRSWEALERGEYVTLHVPLDASTRGLPASARTDSAISAISPSAPVRASSRFAP